ncbi:RHS repeat-associated protein [Paenibacillus polymyxa]|uniref:RHS repeat-associated core domain-containing protein n=1 Tax=Paenibacillus polymyxa TaxID=1406 RepID=UPI0027901C99|nr:RHS repeat-associated core domain-containing protein [Paenibacillus polymyxa]MDQ0047821.1 RHS repeat-associated protein [Paenibacillus polymyxa]
MLHGLVTEPAVQRIRPTTTIQTATEASKVEQRRSRKLTYMICPVNCGLDKTRQAGSCIIISSTVTGDVVGLSDSPGKELNSCSYDIWDGPETVEENVLNVLRYAGGYWDDTTGLQYLRARWYDPGTARFMGEDTYQGEMSDPQSLNWYAYMNSNPLRFIDPSGHIPTAMEYALVNEGTSTWGDAGNDIQQPVGYSDDMRDSILKSSYFVANHKDSEITMVGHSKGGAEAIANAVANNKNAITFNPAVPSLSKYGLSNKNYTANAINFVVTNEILNKTLGTVDTGTTNYLPTQYKIKWWHSDAYKTWQMIRNHKMGSVKNALKEDGYK